MSTPTDPIQVSAGILVQNGRALACQRRPDQAHGNKWEFPGGKREANESIEECLRRELREELGIDADVGREVWRTEHTYPNRPPVALTFFVVRAYRGSLVNRAFAAIRWVDVAELASLDFLAADRELVDRLARGDISLAAEG
jgi:8-oxo-dGTP diphosphatase